MMESIWWQDVKTTQSHCTIWSEESMLCVVLPHIKLYYRKVNTYYSKRYGVDLVRFTHHNKTILCASKRDNNCKSSC